MYGCSPARPRSTGRATPWAITSHAASASSGIPTTRAKSLPRPPGSTPTTAPGTSRSAPATAPSIPSPLSVTTTRPRCAATDRELARVVEVAGGVDLEVDPERAQARLDGRQRLGGPAAAGGGVDDEGDLARHVALILTTRSRG